MMAGSGMGTIHRPFRASNSGSFALISSMWFQANNSAMSGGSYLKRSGWTIGMWVPGVSLPCLAGVESMT